MAINWGLAQQPNAFERAFAEAQQSTMQQRAMQREEEARNALASYAMKPNEAGFNALAQAAPEIAIQERQRMDARATEAQRSQLIMRGAQGDPDAILQIWGFDSATAARFDAREREQAAQGLSYLAESALQIDRLPEANRAAAWDDAIARGVQMGFGDLGEYQGQYSASLLQSVVARAGQMNNLLQGRQPTTFNMQQGATLLERDPITNEVRPVIVPNYNGAPIGAPAGPAPAQPQIAAPTQIRVTPREYSALTQRYGPDAVQQRMANGQVIVTVQTPDEARTLPSGTRILLPDGTEGRVP